MKSMPKHSFCSLQIILVILEKLLTETEKDGNFSWKVLAWLPSQITEMAERVWGLPSGSSCVVRWGIKPQGGVPQKNEGDVHIVVVVVVVVDTCLFVWVDVWSGTIYIYIFFLLEFEKYESDEKNPKAKTFILLNWNIYFSIIHSMRKLQMLIFLEGNVLKYGACISWGFSWKLWCALPIVPNIEGVPTALFICTIS